MCNDTIIELHDLHKSFVSSIVFLTEIQHHAGVACHIIWGWSSHAMIQLVDDGYHNMISIL